MPVGSPTKLIEGNLTGKKKGNSKTPDNVYETWAKCQYIFDVIYYWTMHWVPWYKGSIGNCAFILPALNLYFMVEIN